jgi:transcriptional regulator of arginine metabolism
VKNDRQRTILDIIKNKEVETQEELAALLAEAGFSVTQATVSRDIKALQLVKSQSETGKYRYIVSRPQKANNTEKLLRVIKETVNEVRIAGNIVVIHTFSGSANTIAEIIDTMKIDGVVGTIAGDNTVFVATEPGRTDQVAKTLKGLVID